MFDWMLAVIAAAAVTTVFYFVLTRGEPVENWLADYRYAHRGLHGDTIPENSMQAFALAVEKGYGIELDVHLSSDGIPVVMHDDNLMRMIGMNKPISELTAQELSHLSLAGSGQGIPRLEEVLGMVDGRVPILVELKNTGRAGALEEKVWGLLKNYNGLFAVQSFSPFSMKWFRTHAPKVLRGQLSAQFDDMRGFMPAYQIYGLKNLLSNILARPNFISYDIDSLPKKVVSRLRKKGITILGWTVRNEEQKERANLFCDSMIFENIIP